MSSFWGRGGGCFGGLDSAKTLQTNPINRRNDGQMECGRERIRLTSGESAEMMEDHQVKDHEGPKPNEDSHPANVGWVPRFQNYVGDGVSPEEGSKEFILLPHLAPLIAFPAPYHHRLRPKYAEPARETESQAH